MSGTLEELHVQDLALIEDVWLEFGPGMTVLTGETGAGKTALVGALRLLLGDRADSTLVRAGSRETTVEGRFLVDGQELLARRRVSSEGRSRCTLDGEMTTVSILAERLGPLVDLHGQHDHQALLTPATHVRSLDRYIGARALDAVERYAQARAAYAESERSLQQLEDSLADADRQADYLRFVVDEIDAAKLEGGEDERLEALLPSLRHADKLSEAAAEAFASLRGEQGASDALSEALCALGRVSGLDPSLDDLTSRLESIRADLDDVGVEVRDYGSGLEHDPRVLDQVEARTAALVALKRKYGPTLADVQRSRDDAARKLEAFGSGEQALSAARDALEAASTRLRESGEELDHVRREAASDFEAALTQAAEDLSMSGARFAVRFTELPFDGWTASGPARVEFLYVPAPAEAPRPLAKVASGGEISRVMLALKSVLGDADQTPILVFDEIDAGVGGATATAVGRRLSELARTRQVLVVTHLAQVAVFADRQLVVTKSLDEGRAATTVQVVEGETRVAEIARMLSGADTRTSRAHASELLEAVAGGT